MSSFLLYYSVISLVVAVIDLVVAKLAFSKKGVLGKSLAATCVGCALVDLSYLASIWSEDYFVNSCMSSIYFVCVDAMLVCLLFFLTRFTRRKVNKVGGFALKFCVVYACIEVVLFGINPFKEFVISYVPRASEFAKFSYDMHALYYVHLFFCYAMVAAAITLLVHKLIVLPMEYKRQYVYAITGIVVIVGVNGIFLFAPGLQLYNFLDYSILAYSIGTYIFYWACFQYSAKGMLKLFKMSVFENLDQGLVLFDYDGRMILHNDMVHTLLPQVELKEYMRMDDFLRKCEIRMDEGCENMVVQCYAKDGDVNRPLRCDFRTLQNKRRRVIGHLFMFSNAVLTTDPLTGFHNWDDFCVYADETKNVRRESLVVAACDIVGLSVLNSSKGHHAGDQMIKNLSDKFREKFPSGTYFIRGQDAMLIALCIRGQEASVLELLDQIGKDFEHNIQYAVSVCEPDAVLLESIAVAVRGVRQKKLLDRNSAHSVVLNSLVQALQECDSDTEEHVRRTQTLGAELGRRIGLSDVDQSNLSLLCLLHDIGKIGVPLEILNKPGKLTNEEWEVMRTHTAKGFQIANSSEELKGIADMILHHHERWDGAGYPDCLSREAIPLLSRIIAVVDAYDAMVNTRVYRKALPQRVAIDELKRCAGSQFDPNIVSEFIQMLDSMPSTEKVSTVDEPSRELVREEIAQGDTVVASVVNTVHALKYVRYTLDEQNFIVGIDGDFEKLTGFTKEDIEARHMNQVDLLPEEDRMEYVTQMMEHLGRAPQAFFEHRIRRKDGSIIYVLCFGRRYFDSAVRAGRAEIVVADVSDTYSLRVMVSTERNKARIQQEQWENAFRKDSLTGLLNRSAFKSDTEYKLLEGKTKVMLLMLDVDHFKQYNDNHGHVEGDEFLTLVGQTLLSTLRRDDIAGRMGGEEFAAALFFDPACTDEFMYQRAQQIFDKITMSLKVAANSTSISMGAVIANMTMNNFNALYQAADKLLYKSKEAGRARLSF
ncbi:diguanylate cyclase domain-containing protein [Fibrobacter sp. UWEL]|uniref:diguanylate cyclase domain-containing protein n=1 Tax=Fibrobacter sp. UWEL TaxID=1896209 RepID=UPI00091EB8D2|nr:diguanylate cyclase [Fibrobacter sp. UWEL]SHK99671.1 PAS domain S-box-containing protein/diguanylate cyclase (GGDEF) domain-containing protein [Fibrobacter sp. UWEL]